ncbi:MAG: PEP-CTERM sorting domain-containing protein [Methylococcaceae bacterium]|jgi:hypothetical protein
MFKKTLAIAIFSSFIWQTAEATPILTFNATSQSVNLGSQVGIDVVVNGLEDGGLNEIIAGYNLSLTFDSSILDVFSFSGLSLDPNFFSVTNSAGQIDWNSLSFDTDASLQAIQGNSVTLATIVFNTLGQGNSTLSFSFSDLTGLLATSLDFTVDTASITVTSTSQPQDNVPEPSILMLVSLSALGLAAMKRAKGLNV